MKYLLHEFHRESVILLKQSDHERPADHLSRGLHNLICEPFNHQAAAQYALTALREVVMKVSGEEKCGITALRKLLPSGLAETVAIVIDYVYGHMERKTEPSRAETEFIFNVICSICTFVAHMVESNKYGDKPPRTAEESWRQRSWVRHSISATIEDKIRSLRPYRNATQAELFADIGINVGGELPVDQDLRNNEALCKIYAIVSSSATSLEHISYASSSKEDEKDKRESRSKKSDDEAEDGFRGVGVSESFSPVVASVQVFVNRLGRKQDKSDRERRRRSLYELRCAAHESELLYSIGCALSAFLMAVFIESYRRV